MSKHEQAPTRRDEENNAGTTEYYNHPAFGMIGVSVVTGGTGVLFGSDVRHHQCIRLTISTAEHQRNLSNDWYRADKTLIEIEMSHSQFAQMITNPNRGDGVPCTLNRVKGESIPGILPIESKHEMFRREIEQSAAEKVKDMREQIAALGALIESGKTSKTELRKIHNELARHAQQFAGSVGFVVDQAQEALEKATATARIEVEAVMNQAAMRLGFEAAEASHAPLDLSALNLIIDPPKEQP